MAAGQAITNAIWKMGNPGAARSLASSRKPVRRNFAAARVDRLTPGWTVGALSIDERLKRDLPILRARSRQLELDNDYFKAFLRDLDKNVLGPGGIRLQVKAKDRNGEIDQADSQVVEDAWKDWGKKGNCAVCGRYSWRDIEKLYLKQTARDGEVILREVRGFPNKYRYALQVIPAEALDLSLTRDLPGGGEIKMGVEKDRWGKPVAYWIKTRDSRRENLRHERFLAEEIIHGYFPEDGAQTRGWPWAHSAIRRLTMTGGFEEAALVNARAGAAKMGFYENEGGTGYGPGEDVDEDGEPVGRDPVQDAEPGHLEMLPVGVKFKEFNPTYPNGELPGFLKAMLRGSAAGMGAYYNTWAQDLEGVNFSSLRQGNLDVRDGWMIIQGWLVSGLHSRVFPAFLMQGLLSQGIALPAARFDKFNAPTWLPRRWKGVEPLKEAQANALEHEMLLVSLTELAAERGRDLREVAEQIANERKMMKEEFDLEPKSVMKALTPQQPRKPGDDDEDEDETKDD